MPIYDIKGPDGRIYSVQGPEGASDEQVIAALKRHLGVETKEKSGFFNSIAEGAKTIFSGDEAAKFAAASPEERDALRQKFLASTAGDTQGIALSDVDNIPEFWQWLKQTAGQSLGAMAAPAAVGFASKLAGAPNPMARAVGYTAMGVQYVIDNLARQAQEQDAAIAEGREVPETDVGKAIVGASAQTGLDVGVMELAFKPLLTRFPIVKTLFEGGEIATKRNVAQLAEAFKKGDLKVSNGLVKGTLFGASVEAPQELVQTMIERWQAGLPLADAEAKKEYFEAAVGGGILGGGFGAGQRAMVNQGNIRIARDELARQDALLQEQQAQRQQEIEEQEQAAKEAEKAAKLAERERKRSSEKPPVVGPEAYNALVDSATQFIRDYTAKNGPVETSQNEWYNALQTGLNLKPGEASRILGDLKRRKVLNFRASNDGLNSLYTPTITEQRQKLLTDLDPEIRRVKDVATPEHVTAIDKIIATLGPSSTDEKGNPVYKRLLGTKVAELTAELNRLLGLYGSGAPAGAGIPPSTGTGGASVPPTGQDQADAAAKAKAEAEARAKAEAEARAKAEAEARAKAEAEAKAKAEAEAALKRQEEAAARARAEAEARGEDGEEAARRAGVNAALDDILGLNESPAGQAEAEAKAKAEAEAKAKAEAEARAKAEAEARAKAEAEAAKNKPKLTPEEQRAQVLAKFKEAGAANVALVRAVLGGTQSEAKAYFQQLVDAGVLVRVGKSNRYKLAEESKPPAGEGGVNEDEDEDDGLPPVDPNDLPPEREADEEFNDYMERFNKWKLSRSPEQAARIEKAQRNNAKRVSNKLNKNKEFTAPDQGITYKFVDGGYGVEAYNAKKQLIGSLTTKDGFNVGNIEVAPEFRRKRIAEKMFDRMRRIHGTIGFKDSPLNEDGAKFATYLYATRKLTENEVEVPDFVREAGDKIILKRKAAQVYKAVLKYAIANNGVIAPFNVMQTELGMTREEVGYGYAALAQDGYIEPATQKEKTLTGERTRQLNYFVATQKLKDVIADAKAKQLGQDKPKEVAQAPAEEEVAPDVEEADFREGILNFLKVGPRTDKELKEAYEENLARASDVLADLMAKGKVVYENGTYRLKTAPKPAEPPKTTGDFMIVMQKLSIIRKLFKQLVDAGVPGYTAESLKEALAQAAAAADVSTLDSRIVKLENDIKTYEAGVTSFRTDETARSHNQVTDKSKQAELELAGKPVDSFIDYVVRNGTFFQKIFAKRIKLVIDRIRAEGGSVTTRHVNSTDDFEKIYESNPELSRVNGAVSTAYGDGKVEITVAFTGNRFGYTGYNIETILHELAHVTTTYAYHIGQQPESKAVFPNWRKAYLDINKLHKHVVAELTKLNEENKLSADEKFLLIASNFSKNPKELIAWGLTDTTAKRLLERIPYGEAERGKKRTAWDEFVGIMRRILGLSAQADTALSELLQLTGDFLTKDTPALTSDTVDGLPSGSDMAPSALVIADASQTYTAPPIQPGNFDDTTKRLSQQESVRLDRNKGAKEALGNLFSQNKWERIVTNFQNERRPLKRLSDLLDAAGLLNVFDRVNDIYGEITRSMAMAENKLNETMWRHMVDVDKAVLELSEATGKSKDVVLAELHQYLMGRHEKERRRAFYDMFVPLNNKNNTTLDATLVGNIMVIPRDENGKPLRGASAMPLSSISAPPARLRQIIMAELNQNQDLVSNGYANKMRKALNELIERNNKQNVDGTVDGYSPMLGKKGVRLSTDINDRAYDVIGPYSRNQINEMVSRYNAALADPKSGPILRRMMDPKVGSIVMLQKATIAADKQSNYWSNPVDNRKAFYGWDYYVPLKGSNDAATQRKLDELNFQGERLGGGFNEAQGEMGGRGTDSENPLLQTLVDATKSAIRYGRKGTMEAIGNLIDKDPRTGKRYIDGKKVGNIPFDQRMNMLNDKKFGGDNKFFVYRANGSIDVYEINDKAMKEAIRRTFSAPNKLIDMANSVTSGIGHLHTRYNVAFHPYNFVRDALTNAFTLGAEFGPAMSATLLKAVSTRVAQSGMLTKAGKISYLYKEGRIDEIERMARAGNNFAADALRYFRRGGRVTYLSGTDIREQGERLMRDVRRGDYTRAKEFIDQYVDTFADSFELTSRLSTFGVLRDYYMSKGMSEQEAEIRATTYAKNLANFEQVGKYGRTAGALFMFFRPAATGAVRAIDALTPAFQSWESYKKNIPADILGDPNSAEYKKIEKDFLARKKSAQGMMMALAGAGAMIWTMAWMMADDDEIGRNKVATDKLSLWTRNLRLPLSFLGEKYKDSYFQLPWGFGVGAFGALGAQVAGVAGGYTTVGEAIPNLITIALDSYMPVPVSRIDPTENFSAFAASTFFPSAARPLLEYAMNVDSLGREIYNDRQTRYGDAFTGGRNTPQLWKDVSRLLFNSTGGEADVDPDTLLFFANNYLDGITRVAQSGYGLSLSMSGEKNFSVKEDFAPLSSFVGRASNFDGEKFANLEGQMRELNQRIRSLERDPELYREYMQSNYKEYLAVQVFNRDSNGWLRKLRQMRNQIEASDLSPKTKEERLRGVYLATGYIKRGMIARAEEAGIDI